MELKVTAQSTNEKLSEIENAVDLSRRMFNLKNTEKAYTFYYDETNNIRKLHIREDQKLNVSNLGNFVLGGVVHEGPVRELNLEEIKIRMRLDKGIADVKLKHIASGDFLEMLQSQKLNTFLAWVNENKLLVHFSHLDPIYWSIVDIIDSVLIQIPEFMEHHHILKSDLNEIVKADLENVIAILFNFNYPDIESAKIPAFWDALLGAVEENKNVLNEVNYQMLRGMLQIAKRKKAVEFIQGFNAKKLIESFGVFYVTRMVMFPNSLHIFDEEEVIQDYFSTSGLVPQSFSLKYKFSNSHSEKGIQISDILMGLFGKMFTYLRQTEQAEIIKSRSSMGEVELSNLGYILMLMDKSEIECKAFLNHVASGYELIKVPILFGEK